MHDVIASIDLRKRNLLPVRGPTGLVGGEAAVRQTIIYGSFRVGNIEMRPLFSRTLAEGHDDIFLIRGPGYVLVIVGWQKWMDIRATRVHDIRLIMPCPHRREGDMFAVRQPDRYPCQHITAGQ